MTGLTPLNHDHDRYHDVFCNGFSKIAMKDVVFKEVTQHFDRKVMKELTDTFSRDDQFSLLGVGVGEGHHELHMLKTLSSHFTAIRNVAVEPNENFLETFKSSLAAWCSDAKSEHDVHWFNGPLSKFFTESPLARGKYNLISAIHSLYRIGDTETTFTRLMSLLKDKGIMIIVLSGDDLIYRTHRRNLWLPAYDEFPDKLESEQILELAHREGYTVTSYDLDIEWDLTDVFDEKSELGDRLMDFLTMTAYFRNTAPAEKLNELMSFWRSSCWADEDGRMRTFAGEKIILVSK